MEVSHDNYFVMSVDYKAAAIPFTSFILFYKQNDIIILPANIDLRIELSNSIMIYKNKEAIKQITRLVNQFFFM